MNESVQKGTLIALSMAIIAGGFQVIAEHPWIGVGLIIFGGGLAYGREYLKDQQKAKHEQRKRARRRLV